MDSFVAFIPVRGGSKGIPYKNIKEFCGKPLVYWSIKAACGCCLIDKVYVSTDDELVKKTVEDMNLPKVLVIERDPATATDTASTESAMLEFAGKYDFDRIILIQATSPLITEEDLTKGIKMLIDSKADSLLSVVRQKRFLWGDGMSSAKPVNYDIYNRPFRQQMEGYFVENGAFYVTSRERLLKSKCRLSGKIALYEMEEDTYFEIDEESDWVVSESLKKRRLQRIHKAEMIDFKSVNLLVCDVDGVLTDAGMYYSSEGTEMKKFNTRDGKGIELVKQEGIKVMFLTSENISIVEKRANKLNIDFLFMGIKNKRQKLDEFFKANTDFGYEKTIYIGDDANDQDCIKQCGFSAVPSDANKAVILYADYVCALAGGSGCVREVCDFIIAGRKHE